MDERNGAGIATERSPESLRQRIDELGPWFHNLRIQGEQTAPEHFLGDYPSVKWSRIARAVPSDLKGMSVLDIGCNAGFYSHEMKKRGAGRVLGIDSDEDYLRQARFAAEIQGYDIEFRKMSVYQLDEIEEQFDLVLFLGVLYHLRYPLYALDKVVKRVRGHLLFQTMIRPSRDGIREISPAPEYDFWEENAFRDPDFPGMRFIERTFAGDCTNWWIPNVAGAEAMLRSTGLEIVARPEEETWWCAPAETRRRGRYIQDSELAGEVW
jgi:tRNA (mo5U34)-methyltransferase